METMKIQLQTSQQRCTPPQRHSEKNRLKGRKFDSAQVKLKESQADLFYVIVNGRYYRKC